MRSKVRSNETVVAENSDPHREPTPQAEMHVILGPAPSWKAAVPSDQAHHLITTTGIVVITCTAIGCAVLTSRDSSLTGLALAELILAFLAAALVAACGVIRAGKRQSAKSPEQRPAEPGKQGAGRGTRRR